MPIVSLKKAGCNTFDTSQPSGHATSLVIIGGSPHLLLRVLIDVLVDDLARPDLEEVLARDVLEVLCLQPEQQVLLAMPGHMQNVCQTFLHSRLSH